MTSLGDVVRALAAREGVRAAVLLGADGLPIEHAGPTRDDAETVAALAAGVAQHAERLGEAAGHGALQAGVLEHEQGLVVVARAGRSEWLALLADADADVGPLLHDLRRHGPALAELL